MRKFPTFGALAVLTATIAVGGCRNDARSGPEGMTADLERDLQLASTVRPARAQAVSALELEANGAPSGNKRGQRALVRTPRRAPVESPSTEVAEVVAPELPSTEHAPMVTATITESAPTVAPTTVVEPTVVATGGGPYIGTSSGPSDDGDRDTGETRRGRGGIPGVIIRGGPAGDDHCQPRGRGMPGVGGIGGNIGTIIGIMGGMGGGGRRAPFPRR